MPQCSKVCFARDRHICEHETLHWSWTSGCRDHSRFVAILGLLIVAAGIAIQPAAVKLDMGDLAQIHSLGAAPTFAAVTEGVEAAPTTITNGPVPSTTAS